MTHQESDSDKGIPQRFDVELLIIHPTLDPTEISAALGLEGHFAHRVGDSRRIPAGNTLPGSYRDTRWRHSLRYGVHDQWFAERVTEFVDRLKAHKAFFHGLRSTGGQATLIIQFLGDGYFGDEVPRETLAKLVDLALDFSIECFDTPQSR